MSAGTNLLDELKRRPLLCDGGMGTQLLLRGLRPGEQAERWNVARPKDVQAVHRAYLDAGCDMITTNTFQGTSSAMAQHGHCDVDALNRAGAVLAQEVAAGRAWVLGDVGPSGLMLEPLGDASVEQMLGIFREQIEALRRGGADAVIVETMSDPAELGVAVRAAKEIAPWPVIATVAFQHGGEPGEFRTMMGTTVQEAMSVAVEAGADVVGANCGTALSLDDYRILSEQLVRAAGGTPVILQPNAGAPRMVDGGTRYDATPQQMAELVPVLLEAGVRVIGGCCGTTPEHLGAMAGAMPPSR
jgi:5-methyltetrahydrofolate--homocysteine methyltransferase